VERLVPARRDSHAERGNEIVNGSHLVKRQTLVELTVFVLLVALGAGARLYFQHLPNFAPVAALALFSGYYFRSWLAAACVPLAAMAISDWFIGGYDPLLMAVVYGMLAVPVTSRGLLRTRFKMTGRSPAGTAASVAALLTCALAMSFFFFLVTNFAWWATSGMYERSLGGLAQNYLQALPFFRFTLTGDLLFACLLFGGYGMSMQVMARCVSSPAPETASA
jgi:hypothetical protein